MEKIKQWFRDTFLKASRQDMAIIALAEYLEDPMHDQYKVKQHILEILELEYVNDKTKPLQ